MSKTTTDEAKTIEDAKELCVMVGFDADDCDTGYFTYTSREGGNGTDCEPDPDTLKAARALVKQIREMGLEATRVVCDEWVSVCFGLPGSGAKEAM